MQGASDYLSSGNMTDLLELGGGATDKLYLALVQCFAVILCGYIAGRLGVITRAEANGLNTFVGTFALPSLIFMSLAKLDLALVNWRFLLAITIAKSFVFFAVLTVTLVIVRPTNPGRAALFAIFATQSNDFAIGYPMIDALYRDTHPEYSAHLYLLAPISLAILNPIGFVLLEIGKRRSEEPENNRWTVFASTAKGIALNPVLLMTVLGIVGNLVTKHHVPPLLSVVLDVFGNAFSASALFLLGLMMVGKVHTLKGAALVIPGILISVKLLALPLIIRESVILLDAGENATETRDLSTYGFLYGTIPTAPALFVFTLRYAVDIDLIASAMVACTFLSAPLMFVSAKMINAVSGNVTPGDYAQQLNAFSLDTSAISAAACCWLLVCFVALGGRKYMRLTHRMTICLVVAQLLTAIGVIIWTTLDQSSIGSPIWYIQFVLITGGVYASRIWTAALAATLLFLSCRSTSFVDKFQKWFLPVGVGAPLLIVSMMALLLTPEEVDDVDKGNPNFQLGRIQAAVSTLVLVFCFVVTLGCLVLQQRYQRRNNPTGYSSLNPPLSTSDRENSRTQLVDDEDVAADTTEAPTADLIGCSGADPLPTTGDRVNSRTALVDVEDLVPDTNGASTAACEFNNGCPSLGCSMNRNRESCGQDSDWEAEISPEGSDDLQTLRHLVLLIMLLCSMFVGLSLSVGTLVLEQMTGIYAEVAFLDVALNFGQSLIAFAIFGLDPGLGAIGCWLRRFCQKLRGVPDLQLPDEAALSPEVLSIRDQFARCYLADCRARISVCRRRMLRVYRGVFAGSDLVDWLMEAGVARNREDAVRYGRCLLESRLLSHVDGAHHFQDQNLLYTFRA